MLIAASIVLLLGTALLIKGLTGRRIGDEPRCRSCRYNLTGVESANCPECGRPWTRTTAAVGLRKRNKRAIGLGLVFLLSGGTLSIGTATGYIQKTNWYSRLPASWVLFAAKHGSHDAFDVLEQRLDNNQLNAAQVQSVIETALAIQAAPRIQPMTGVWLELLSSLEWSHALSGAQRSRYLSQLIRVTAVLDPRVQPGEPLQMTLNWAVRAPARSRFGAFVVHEMKMSDGTPLAKETKIAFPLGNPSSQVYLQSPADRSTRFELPINHLSPGRHVVQLNLQTNIVGGMPAVVLAQSTVFPTKLIPGSIPSIRLANFLLQANLAAAYRRSSPGPVLWSESQQFTFPIEVLPSSKGNIRPVASARSKKEPPK